ncbi:16S rRNA (uracil(1498)-N(3))-methyltransferase [Ferruginivarius sediminum]|uniref:Ribosomal RNA small subunit methyltransferase E n=1 Tax=Ferruginivarius sediminum TaxID=2661937 RepID=A0A369TKT2_9PROT|nr:16S rRNA (uracil(1498)-N(3))-methyltransferase [Ferruginivarius sediminum]RDD63516.1 16S rRNA (uracil(1498)-N(3))-methyltransferase [Ferruginivarius sediminum]
MSRTGTATRLFVEEDLAAGRVLGLDHARAHFLRSVLRLGRGAQLALFNGRDGEWLARVEGLGKGWASLEVLSQSRPQQGEPDLWLVFAPIKRARLDFMIEKATELGVSVLQPIFTQHTDVSRVNTDRLAANAREAAEQCERLSVPEVHEPKQFRDLLDGWPAERRLLLCAESGEARPIAGALADISAGFVGQEKDQAVSGPWAVMTGPEGGFHASELDALAKLPFVTPVGLGPRVLRADTAALAALACWQAWLGDGRARPPFRAD